MIQEGGRGRAREGETTKRVRGGWTGMERSLFTQRPHGGHQQWGLPTACCSTAIINIPDVQETTQPDRLGQVMVLFYASDEGMYQMVRLCFY